MKPLEEEILEYAYVMKMKYWADSISLAKISYKMQRHVRAVKSAVNDLIAKGLLERRYEGASLSYTISRKGIDLIEKNGLVKIRDWVTEA